MTENKTDLVRYPNWQGESRNASFAIFSCHETKMLSIRTKLLILNRVLVTLLNQKISQNFGRTIIQNRVKSMLVSFENIAKVNSDKFSKFSEIFKIASSRFFVMFGIFGLGNMDIFSKFVDCFVACLSVLQILAKLIMNKIANFSKIFKLELNRFLVMLSIRTKLLNFVKVNN